MTGDHSGPTLRQAQGERIFVIADTALRLSPSKPQHNPAPTLRQAQGERKKTARGLSLSKPVNAVRGEAGIEIGGAVLRLRPSFAALVAAEAELGSLFALVERAAAGALGLAEMAGLFWHCLDPQPAMTRAAFSEALITGGLAAATPALKLLLTQILAGR